MRRGSSNTKIIFTKEKKTSFIYIKFFFMSFFNGFDFESTIFRYSIIMCELPVDAARNFTQKFMYNPKTYLMKMYFIYVLVLS